jgi:DNA-binding MarR family transcriptional regulator
MAKKSGVPRKPAPVLAAAGALDLDRFGPFLLNSLTRRFNVRLERVFRRKSLSIYDWRLLATLANTDLNRPADVADYIATDPSTLSRMIDRFVRAGVMVRRKPAGEARITELELTKSGWALYDSALSVITLECERLQAPLTARENDELTRLLLKISDSYEPWTPMRSRKSAA